LKFSTYKTEKIRGIIFFMKLDFLEARYRSIGIG
jgi:hypothetical protein